MAFTTQLRPAPSARPRSCTPAAAAARSQRTALANRPLLARSRALVVSAVAGQAGGARAAASPSLQLGTAKLPADVDVEAFKASLYQWATTLTTNGRNLPFALPLRADLLPDGFQISLLRVAQGGGVCSVADVVASVESVGDAGNVLMVRLFEAEGSSMYLGPAGASGSGGAASDARLQTLLSALVDVPLLMQTMPAAIKRAAIASR